jgi:hypothetical protein
MTRHVAGLPAPLAAVVLILFCAPQVFAGDPIPPKEALENAFPEQKTYLPYAGRNFPT